MLQNLNLSLQTWSLDAPEGLFCINCLNLSHESQLCGVAVATGHRGGDYSNIYIYTYIHTHTHTYIYIYSISYFLLFSSIFFLLSTPTSHLSFSSLSGFSFSITPFSFSSASSPCSSCCRSYSVSPVILFFYNVTTCRIVSTEAQTTKRFCSVSLQLKFCKEISFPQPYNMRALRSLRTLTSLKHWKAPCSFSRRLSLWADTVTHYTFYFLSQTICQLPNLHKEARP